MAGNDGDGAGEAFRIVLEVDGEVDEAGRAAVERVIRAALRRHRAEVGFLDDEPAVMGVRSVEALGPVGR